ncbi:MAG: 7-carboxy-7-deazaguanine synthase QueE [Gammaproteobacteria bacterium]|nr:7-carboxy-7-deazaguanine synthase QueE [Gammaproteobacteria bacterium]
MLESILESIRVNVQPEAAGQRLKLTEIFFSLQGEARTVGLPTVFVRLTGCPLRCHYCDTAYAFTGGEWWTCEDVLAKVASYSARYVTVTGGEPLAQKNCFGLLEKLCDAGYEVSLETSGAIDVSKVDVRVSKVLDIKTPDSGEQARNLWTNLDYITKHDQIKFVICSRADYAWAKTILQQYALSSRCELLFSPSHGQLSNRELAEWILQDGVPVRFQVQLHKYIWGDTPGH